MKYLATVAFWISLLCMPCLSFAGIDDEASRALTVKCEYSDYKTFQFESVLIEGAKQSAGETASTKIFMRGEKSGKVTYRVESGQVAECVFPSGHRVRTKVGEGVARSYGMCGGNPEVFGSIWVNKRKIASRVWFAGHCRELSDGPDVSFKVVGFQNISVEKCHSLGPTEEDVKDSDSGSKSKQPLSVCVGYPEISRFAPDEIEYPRPGHKVPVAGDIELLEGSHEVCKIVHEELKEDFHTFRRDSGQKSVKWSRPSWSASSVELPKELDGSRESIFDFDNDGKLDRVFSRDFESTYMDGSVLLVELGRSVTELIVPGSPMDSSSWLLPCQMTATQYEIQGCPLFSQKGESAGFSMKAKATKDPINFRARYARLSPFIFEGQNFIEVSSQSVDTTDFVGVLKPMPNRSVQQMCLFRRVAENF